VASQVLNSGFENLFNKEKMFIIDRVEAVALLGYR